MVVDRRSSAIMMWPKHRRPTADDP